MQFPPPPPPKIGGERERGRERERFNGCAKQRVVVLLHRSGEWLERKGKVVAIVAIIVIATVICFILITVSSSLLPWYYFHVASCCRWSILKKHVALCKQRIGPCIQAHQEQISKDITHFGEIFIILRSNFSSSSCHRRNTPREKALDTLAKFVEELKVLQTQARDLIELQELLEASIFNFSLLKE